MGSEVAEKTQQLVSLAQNGDASALDRLCGVYGERLRRIVRLRMGPELRSQLESMDLVQDALVAAVGNLDGFAYRDEGDFLRWLARVAENRIRDHIDRMHAAKRDVRREAQFPAADSLAGDRPAAAAVPIVTTTPSLVLRRREEFDRLELAMDRLPSEYRQVIVLAKIEGVRHKEIAARLNKTPAAVAKLLSRAIVALANEFERV